MESRDIILRPVITEETTSKMDDKTYTFDVDLRATKTQVKKAVEDIFDVKVVRVNIMNVRGKLKRQGRYAGYTKKRRKAIVTLTPDSKEIELFNEE
ncbi:50S ribosomal protein L23 [Lentilactobacillus kefiri]|jgi:large subunit ribosomal protein L23|uniref:Large ribosomal subunit protein uL23 n=2 Tax=Lentilactobacillus kefiri TaxID=33962 RepID=A0A8E1V1D1_LENKE|nr:50S ribosomal protein L23 [Lentilactobacillus kefiri]KRL52372.1 50S ribosomal protein L25 [Lentilactobacillus parakefiri DSM 10551]KRM49540.1 50S ribosomal protein L25 [Lentilactobacillus kefiri DSM 20587 = JCM 5818]MCJ2162280.1 50S ribosomal protein L23 [Lentilactobacillus kefiri]MCP9368641.1 50S ribosomal protein L23 [Lentilactobacillus kefiri]MDH5107681.1 50S ribosomal protein L23 [Lentilactobacillus kefiri]